MDLGNTKLVRRLRDRPARPFVAGAFVLFFVGLGVVVGLYPGATFWPGLVGNFGASLAAFMLALSWDQRHGATLIGNPWRYPLVNLFGGVLHGGCAARCA